MSLSSAGGGGGGKSHMLELLELAGHLRDEKLFINQEKKALHGLFTSLDESSREVHGLNWILQQQRCIATDLILGSPNVSPEVCFVKFNALEDTSFLDGYKLLTHHEIRVGKFIKGFRESPEMVALCLFRAEGSGPSCLQQTVRTVMLQLYGGLLLPEDEMLASSVLKHLLRLQVTAGKVKSPVKFVTKRHSAFVQAFKFLTECSPSSKPFLTVAFHDPTVALLAEDEWLYDVETDKALSRFSHAELTWRFGSPGSESFKQKVEVYQNRIVGKLASLVERFLHGLEFGAPVFPRSIAGLLKTAYESFKLVSPKSETSSSNSGTKYWSGSSGTSSTDLTNAFQEETKDCTTRKKGANGEEGEGKPTAEDAELSLEAKRACLYLLFNVFVCPSICDPEVRGIVFDVPVGDVARHNLMQIAQLIQVLAISSFGGDVDAKYKDICEKFDKDCLSFVLDSIICNKSTEEAEGGSSGNRGNDPSNSHTQRSSVLISPQEFVDLMDVVHATASSPPQSDDVTVVKEHRGLKDLVVSTNLPCMQTIRTCCQKYLVQSHDVPSQEAFHSERMLVSSYSSSIGSKRQDEGFISRSTSTTVSRSLSNKRSRSKTSSCTFQDPVVGGHQPPEVLVISLGVYSDCPGMLPEQKVMERELKSRKYKLQANSVLPGEEDEDVKQQQQQSTNNDSNNNINNNVGNNNNSLLISGKRTRFSLSHDTDSIEPNNEGVSEEAVSSHSTDDDDDDNNNSTDNNSNDNLSDMAYSANLSGRNTPSIVSGRDTPVSLMSGGVESSRMVIAEVVINSSASQAGGPGRIHSRSTGDSTSAGGNAVGDATGAFQEASAIRGGGGVVSVVVGGGGGGSGRDSLRKRDVRRDDVTDKFGKFDIRQDIELEAKSTVSDTWSTDVLASDSEPPPEQNHLVRLEEVVEENILPPRVGGGGSMGAAPSETGISETASDAWSTDVLASDTSERQAERLLELDQDETCSLSGRSTLSLAGLSTITNDSGLDKSHSTETPTHPLVSTTKHHRHHHHQQQQSGNDPRTYPSLLRPFAASREDPNPAEVFDNLSDSSSHKGASSSFEVFDSLEGETVPAHGSAFLPKNEYNKGGSDFDTLSNTVPSASLGGPSSDYLPSNKNSYNNISNSNNKRLFDNPANAVGRNSDQFLSQKRLHDFSDESEATSSQNLSNPKMATNYGDGFEMFDPFAPVGVRSQGRELVKNINSSSVDNLDTLVPASDNLLLTSRASSSMTHICDETTAQSTNHPVSFPQARGEVNRSGRAELKKKSGIFGTFRERLSKVNQANRRKTSRSSEDGWHQVNSPAVLIDLEGDSGDAACSSRELKTNSWKNEAIVNTENILAKYRKSPVSETPTPLNESTTTDQQQHQQEQLLTSESFPNTSYTTSPLFHHSLPGGPWGADGDATDSTKTPGTFRQSAGTDLFADAKKKLRLVLSTVDCSQFKSSEGRSLQGPLDGPQLSSSLSSSLLKKRNQETRGVEHHGRPEAGRGGAGAGESSAGKEQLIMLLKMLLADSLVADDKILATQLHETIRCLACFDTHEIKRLLRSLRDDYKMRSYYIAYLTRCKKSVLASIAFYDSLLCRVKRERSLVNKYLVSVMTRLHLEKKEIQFLRFISEFQRLLLFDEKSDLLDQFLYLHHEEMRSDPSWKAASESQLDEAQLFMERTIMSHIYTQALFPNGDGDILRDKKMEDHMRQLSRVITPDNRYLKILPAYHNECPWLAAQKELTMINTFKTPEDKLECVVRCCSTIMTLLNLALTGGTSTNRSSDGSKGSGDGDDGSSKGNCGGIPAADDFMPVLIYVIIMSCTPNLLSTIQYVKSYCEKADAPDDGRGDTLERGRRRNVFSNGEKFYWWMQFVAAVEFIKTMEYGD